MGQVNSPENNHNNQNHINNQMKISEFAKNYKNKAKNESNSYIVILLCIIHIYSCKQRFF